MSIDREQHGHRQAALRWAGLTLVGCALLLAGCGRSSASSRAKRFWPQEIADEKAETARHTTLSWTRATRR